jgi:CRISPR/Cas system-associated exonuclease Cas4 (RecB family)
MNIPHLSVSRKQLFNECWLKYRFQYHDKIKIDEPEPEYFTYGALVHTIAELYVGNQGKKSMSKITEQILSGEIEYDEGKKKPNLSSDYLKKLPNHLKAIERLTEKIGFGGELEWEFRYDLDPPHKRNIYGFIDRLVVKENKAIVVDYKTSRDGWFRKNSNNITGDLQLRCYAMVVWRKLRIPPENITCMLHYLDGDEMVGAKFTENTLVKTERDLLETYMEIHGMKPEEAVGRVGKHCERCAYNKICPAYQGAY